MCLNRCVFYFVVLLAFKVLEPIQLSKVELIMTIHNPNIYIYTYTYIIKTMENWQKNNHSFFFALMRRVRYYFPSVFFVCLFNHS